MSTTYTRVIPRDLFNEGNLLKCLGKLWIETERFHSGQVEFEHDGEPFAISLSDDDGSLSIDNVSIRINGTGYRFYRPLNSRQPWPLYFDLNDETIGVFNDDGTLSSDMLKVVAC